MRESLEYCEDWVARRYREILGIDLPHDSVRIRWLTSDSLTQEAQREEGRNLVIEDSDVGWLIFLLPYDSSRIERQVNQALGLRSRLLRESNYTGTANAGEQDDPFSSWRVGLVWLVPESSWDDWQQRIIELRRESGAAEEISLDAVRITENNVERALDLHGMPRLLLHTRALLRQSPDLTERWLSADSQVAAEMTDFSARFRTSRARTVSRELEARAKSFESATIDGISNAPRRFESFRVQFFRNLTSLEIAVQRGTDATAEAIVLFGPNGTGKSSFAEALSLAAFGTSPRLEEYLEDTDVGRASAESYVAQYLTPLSSPDQEPKYQWGNKPECSFTPTPDDESRRRYEGIVLNQEDSIEFTKISRERLAGKVLQGYSTLADQLLGWLNSAERDANESKTAFTRAHGLSGAIKRSSTAYNRLATVMLADQLQRPSPEFVEWLRFLERLADDDGDYATALASDWRTQEDTSASRLADTLARLREHNASRSDLAQAIRETLEEFDSIANRSGEFCDRMGNRTNTLGEQLEESLAQIDSWGAWLAVRSTTQIESGAESKVTQTEVEDLAKARNELETDRKSLRDRLSLLEQARKFLASHWAKQNPDTCPVCESNVADRQGIQVVVAAIEVETSTSIEELRTRQIEIRERQRLLDEQLRAAGLMTCPIATEDQDRLRAWADPFLPDGTTLEAYIVDPQSRQQLKLDLARMRALPDAPRPYADVVQESERLAADYVALTEEADRVLEGPQSIGEVRKAFEERLERVLLEHLPATLGKVWGEFALALTAAPWLLPAKPTLALAQRGKSLSVKVEDSDRYVRYVYNAAERHLLGLAWFFTYYLAKRRFDESWILLDDPAQEMDQPSFRELVRMWETLLRLHQKMRRPFTLITALHQEERALDAARATNGKLYILGWKKKQEDTSSKPSVKKVVLLAPGYHPLKSESAFDEIKN